MDIEDLPLDHQDVWEEIPGVPYLSDDEANIAVQLYEQGFMGHSDDEGYSAALAHAAREEFLDFMGLDYEDFPWDEWREAMGYE